MPTLKKTSTNKTSKKNAGWDKRLNGKNTDWAKGRRYKKKKSTTGTKRRTSKKLPRNNVKCKKQLYGQNVI
jgi:hypothetical protein